MISNESFAGALSKIEKMALQGQTGYICLSNVHMVVEGIFNPAFNWLSYTNNWKHQAQAQQEESVHTKELMEKKMYT